MARVAQGKGLAYAPLIKEKAKTWPGGCSGAAKGPLASGGARLYMATLKMPPSKAPGCP